ncbi:ribonuclease P protein component [bacterium]|nr:ribonuclease P protein component [bacterium]
MSVNHDFRLPKKEILKKSHDFQCVLKRGKRWEGKIIKCFYFKADERKVGFVVPRRLGKAVIRNRIKRLMREAYRHHKYAVGEFWILIMAKKTGELPKLKQIETEFCQCIRQEGLASSTFD